MNPKSKGSVSCYFFYVQVASPTTTSEANVQKPTTVSLLASQQKVQVQQEKKVPVEQKVVMQKAAVPQPGKMGPQLLNVSSVQLVNPRTNQGQIQTITKPLLTKNNAPILTGVKLVNTQQGGGFLVLTLVGCCFGVLKVFCFCLVKMVATSSTMVQNAIQPPKTSTNITKSPQTVAQQPAGVARVQNRPTQIITMESLLQNAQQLRVASAGKGL